ncbi:MAG: TraC family protein, partial [Bdellovibrionales bacterium]|nr:TraC family protein [Bdellovibrionales bacterium]
MENKSLGNLVPIWHFDNDLIFYKDGSFGAGFKIQGKDLSCSSVDSINQYSRDLEQMINTCPEGLKIQFFFHLNSNCSGFIDNHRELSKTASNNYKAIADSRINFLSEANHNKEFYLPEINFFIRGQDNDLTKNNILQKESRFIEISKKEYQGNKEEFLKSVGQFYSSLKKIDSNARMLQKEEWFNLIFRFLNLSRLEKNEMPLLRNESNPFCPSLVEQITLTDLFVNKDSIKIGEYYFKAISLKTLPDGETFPTMGRSLLNLPFHFWLSQTIEVHDQKKEIDKLNLQRRFANSLATGSSKLRDLESESILTNLERLIEDLLQGSEKVVSMDTTVIVWSSDANDLERKADEVLKAFNSMNRSEGLIETYACLEAFLSAIPGNCKGFRQKKMKSSNAAHILVPYSSWLGNKSPVCLLPNREGVPFSLDPFASELPNWNGVVFGGSGSGKSFLICQLMLMFYGQIPNPKIVWIDNGASSQKLLEVLEGEFIDLRPSSGICLNMFDLPTGETKPDSAKVKLILAALENILKEDGQNG